MASKSKGSAQFRGVQVYGEPATAAEVRFTEAQLAGCRRHHMDGPRFGCPVCFLTLVYAQVDPPMVDVAVGAMKALQRLNPADEVAGELLARFNSIPERMNAAHLVVEEGGDA